MDEHELARDQLPLGLLVAQSLGADVFLLTQRDHPILAALIGAEALDERAKQLADGFDVLW